MPGKKAKLSGLEWEIMRAIWQTGNNVTVREVLESAYPNGEKAYTTVQTVMNNLVEKGFLKKKKTGMVNFYSMSKKQQEVIASEISSFLQRTFSGSFTEMVNFMVKSHKLSRRDIEELRIMINNTDGKGEK